MCGAGGGGMWGCGCVFSRWREGRGKRYQEYVPASGERELNK